LTPDWYSIFFSNRYVFYTKLLSFWSNTFYLLPLFTDHTDHFFHFMAVLINIHPIIQPRLLWTISSHSNNPLQNINWKVSIITETRRPASSPFHQLNPWSNIKGSNKPIGNNRMQFNRFSFNSSRLWFKKTSFQDQNNSRLYCRFIGMRVKTVEPNTMPRNIIRINPDTACDSMIFLLRSK